MTGLLGSDFAELGHESLVVFTTLNRYGQKMESRIVGYFTWMLPYDLGRHTAQRFRSVQELVSAILFDDAIVIHNNRSWTVQKGRLSVDAKVE
jgi:hypothetical protein